MSTQKYGTVEYQSVEAGYFERRGLRRHAGVAALWALGVGAVISGHYSGWNLGLAVGGWGGMLLATIAITIMYVGLVFSLARIGIRAGAQGSARSIRRDRRAIRPARDRRRQASPRLRAG